MFGEVAIKGDRIGGIFKQVEAVVFGGRGRSNCKDDFDVIGADGWVDGAGKSGWLKVGGGTEELNTDGTNDFFLDGDQFFPGKIAVFSNLYLVVSRNKIDSVVGGRSQPAIKVNGSGFGGRSGGEKAGGLKLGAVVEA